jgi:hypothetical protein
METYNSIRPVDPLVNDYINYESNVDTNTNLDSKNINNNSNIDIYTDEEVLEALNNNDIGKYLELIRKKKINKYYPKLEIERKKEIEKQKEIEIEKKKELDELQKKYDMQRKKYQMSMLLSIYSQIENLENTINSFNPYKNKK